MGRQPVLPCFAARLAVAGLVLALASVGLPAALRAAETEPVGQRIVGVVVSGNVRVNTNRILGQMRLREGSVYNPTTQDEDVKRIYALGDFDDVRIDPQPGSEGLTLLVKVKERPTLENVVFLGNRKFSDKDLAETVGLSSGGILDRGKIFAGVRAIERQYRDAGYHFVHVALDARLLSEGRIAQYTITEGPAVRISAIEFSGNASVDSSELRNQMDSKAYFPIFSSGVLDEDQLDRDIAAVRTFYIDQGFRDIRIDRVMDFSPDKTRLVVRVVIDEGPRYHVRSVALQGVQRFAPSLLEQQMAVKPGAPYTADAMKHDITLIRDTYGEVGFIDTTIEPIVDFTSEPGTVDVTLKVGEGRLVTIGDIRIEGNRLTQAKVIRRELAFYPEEPVNTKLIDRAKRRLEGTGLFSPGSVDITPISTSSPDVVNLVVRVQEAEMNRLILGAGISSDQGVIGNISLVERNFDLMAWPRPPTSSGAASRSGGPARRFNSSWRPAPKFRSTGSISAIRTWPTRRTASRPASSISSASGRPTTRIGAAWTSVSARSCGRTSRGSSTCDWKPSTSTRSPPPRGGRPQGRRAVDPDERRRRPHTRHHRQPPLPDGRVPLERVGRAGRGPRRQLHLHEGDRGCPQVLDGHP